MLSVFMSSVADNTAYPRITETYRKKFRTVHKQQ